MRCLIICDGTLPVPPSGYGGTERIADALCRGLVTHGCEVTLMGHPDSTAPARLISHLAPTRRWTDRAFRKIAFQASSLLASLEADVCINFGRLDYLWALGICRPELPTVFVFQNPVTDADVRKIDALGFKQLRLVSISDHQRQHLASSSRWTTIPNCVNTDRLKFSPTPDRYVAFLGRLTRNKGIDLAIEAARLADKPLRIAGNVPQTPEDLTFFREQVEPRIGSGIEWIGEIGDDQKSAFLGGALALLMPIRWPEPFGIVMAEALACGTPIIAYPHGAAKEIVLSGQNGFFASSVPEMVDRIRDVHNIDRMNCREDCVKRFSESVVIRRYVDLINIASFDSAAT